MIYHLANCTLDAMLHLSMNEFTTPEREQKLGVMVRLVQFSRLDIYQLCLSSRLFSFGPNGIMAFFYYTVDI